MLEGLVWCVSWIPDGKTLATGDDNGVQLWQKDGTFITSIEANALSYSWSPDSMVIAIGVDNTIFLKEESCYTL